MLLMLVLAIAVYCFTWPGRKIGTDAAVNEGARILCTEDAQRIVTFLRRPHIPTVSDDKLDCMPEMVFTVTDGGNQYGISIHAHTNKAGLAINDERWGYFYLPTWEIKTLEEVFE